MDSECINDCTSRYDFGSKLDPEGTQTGTIRELLKEINKNYDPIGGEQATYNSLKRILGFIHLFTEDDFTDLDKPVPLSVLKTIKLLLFTGRGSKRNLIDLIEPPTEENPATMEFCSGTTISRDKVGSEMIRSMTESLALDIASEKLAQFDELARPNERASFAERLNSHVEQTNDVISQLFNDWQPQDSCAQAKSYRSLSKKIDVMRYIRASDFITPVHESIYCYLKSLGLQHFIAHHRTFIRTVKISDQINSIHGESVHLCATFSSIKGETVSLEEKIVSVRDFPKMVAIYHKEFNSLVKAATGLVTRKKRFVENIKFAQVILASYGYRCHDESNIDARILSLIDIVAALCSVRYQQDKRTEYDPLWSGRESQGTSPQRLFEKGLRKNDPHQHQGVAQIYLYRFSEYQAAFKGMSESYHEWMVYQVSRLDAYHRILQLNDINLITTSAYHFDEICKQEAMYIVDGYTSDSM